MTDIGQSSWPEARGPHLPDVLTRIPLQVWPFVVAAVVTVLADVDSVIAIGDTRFGLTSSISGALRLVASLALPLWGAAFFWRHPDGWRMARAIAVGTILAAAYALFGPVGHAIMSSLAIVDEDQAIAVSLVTTSVSTIIGIAAVVAVAIGLRRARRRPDGAEPVRGLVPVLVLVTLTTAALSVLWLRGAELTALNVIAFVTNVVLNVGELLAWSALIAIGVAGWLADERPAPGWALAAAAGAAMVVGQALGVSVVLLFAPSSTTGVPIGYDLTLWIRTLAAPLLLAAFAVGLPAISSDREAATTPGSAGS
jgi:hypothetical protein